MRGFLSVLIVVTVVCPLCADTVIFSEDFSTGTVGNAVAGWNGWNGDTGVQISSTVLDQGGSAALASGIWQGVNKGFAYTPAAGDVYELTATLNAGNSSNYVDFGLRAGDPAAGGAVFPRVVANLYQGSINFQIDSDSHAGGAQVDMTKTVDVKMLIPDVGGTVYSYWRYHGGPDWIPAGLALGSDIATTPLAAYDFVRFAFDGSGSGIDSISLIVKPVPEPGAFMLMATGVLGLLAHAWRKRK